MAYDAWTVWGASDEDDDFTEAGMSSSSSCSPDTCREIEERVAVSWNYKYLIMLPQPISVRPFDTAVIVSLGHDVCVDARQIAVLLRECETLVQLDVATRLPVPRGYQLLAMLGAGKYSPPSPPRTVRRDIPVIGHDYNDIDRDSLHIFSSTATSCALSIRERPQYGCAALLFKELAIAIGRQLTVVKLTFLPVVRMKSVNNRKEPKNQHVLRITRCNGSTAYLTLVEIMLAHLLQFASIAEAGRLTLDHAPCLASNF